MHTSLEFPREDRFVSAVPQVAPLRPALVALALLAGLTLVVTAAAASGVLPAQDDPAWQELAGP